MEYLKELQRHFAELSAPTPGQLQQAIQECRFTADFARTFATEPEGLPYGKNILWTSDTVQAVVIHLPAHSATYIHDHGESVGCAYVLEGTVVNTVYRMNPEGDAIPVRTEHVANGSFFQADKNQIHRMSNPAGGRAVSFHVYSPPLMGARTYKEAIAASGSGAVPVMAD
jgi:cysteine dioxygenase